jgi:hypothetical protein
LAFAAGAVAARRNGGYASLRWRPRRKKQAKKMRTCAQCSKFCSRVGTATKFDVNNIYIARGLSYTGTK